VIPVERHATAAQPTLTDEERNAQLLDKILRQ